MSWFRTIVLAVLLASLAGTASAVVLDESGPIIRPIVHTVFWCPINFYYTTIFTATGSEISAEFVAQNRANDGNGWMQQRIDNVMLVPKSVYDANLGPAGAASAEIFCVFEGDPLFFFQNVPPGDILFFDDFATAPDPGWSLSDGAYYVDSSVPSSSAPNDLLNPSNDPKGGSLGLGDEFDMNPTSSTSITIGGLTAGTEYVLHLWWKSKADDDPNGGTFPDGDLFITVSSDDPNPVERTTWGAIKAAYGE